MQLHLREKQELFEANAALRTVLRRQGVPDAQLEAEVKRINTQVGAGQLFDEACRSCKQAALLPSLHDQTTACVPGCPIQVDAMAAAEQGVNQVLVLAAQVRGWGREAVGCSPNCTPPSDVHAASHACITTATAAEILS